MKPLLDLEANECRWPVNNARPHLFCGEPKQDGSSYCACHKAKGAAAVQPEKLTNVTVGRMADWLGGGRARKASALNAEQRRPVDTHMRINRSGRSE